MKTRHRRRGRLRLRGITPRRLAAAKRALQRERDRHALFADQVASEQPTAEERITKSDLGVIEYDQGHRDLAATHWRWGRMQLRNCPEIAEEILAKWNRSSIPDTGTYFADFVRCAIRARGLTIKE